MDGWITVGTKLDTKQLEKDVKTAENKMKQYEKEAQKLAEQKAKINLDLSSYEKEKQKIKENTDLTLKKAQTEEQVTEVLEMENLELSKLSEKYSETFKKTEEIEKSISQNSNQQEILNNEIQEMNEKLSQSKGFENVKNSINQVSNSMSGVIKKVAKWSLAIFSVRSAYSFVRQAISTVSQYNQQMATDIEYIRWAMANTLAPIIEYIIKLVRILLTYINYIWKAWFGKELFASSKDFQNMQKSSKKTASNVKEMKKDLAGFDEMNILQDQDNILTGDDSIDINIPSFDLASEDIEIPWWVDWIAKNKDTILTIAAAIGGLFAASKIAGWLSNIGKLFGSDSGTGLLGLLGTLKNIALVGGALVITGYVAAKFTQDVKNLKNDLNNIIDNSEEGQKNWLKNEENINNIINVQNINRSNGLELLKKSQGIFGKITKLSVEERKAAVQVVKNSELVLEREMEIYNTNKLNDDEKKKLLENIKKQIEYNDTVIQKLEEQGEDTTELVSINDKYKESFKLINDELYISGDLTNQLIDNFEEEDGLLKNLDSQLQTNNEEYSKNLDIAKKISEENQNIINQEIDMYKNGQLTNDEKQTLLDNIRDQVYYNDEIIRRLEQQGQDTSDLKARNDGLKRNWENIYGEVNNTKVKFDEFNRTPLNNKNMTIDVGMNTNRAETIWETLMRKIKEGIGFIFGGGFGGGGGGGRGFAKGGIIYSGISNIKPIKCARGSIISQPGRGVPLTSAVGGEEGREGVIPLTDAQQMSLLGEAIGKYININLTNITRLDNRQIAKEQKRISAQNDFTFNR